MSLILIEFEKNLRIANLYVSETIASQVENVLIQNGYTVEFQSTGNGHLVNNPTFTETYHGVVPLGDVRSIEEDIDVIRKSLTESLPHLQIQEKDVTGNTRFL